MTTNLEKLVRKFFNSWLKDYSPIYNSRPPFLDGLELDIYYPTLKFAIEADGFTHEASRKQKQNDKKKDWICEYNKIYLLRITDPKQLLNKDFINKVRDKIAVKFKNSYIKNSLIQNIINYKPKKIQGLAHKVHMSNKAIIMREKLEDSALVQKKESSFAKKKAEYLIRNS